MPTLAHPGMVITLLDNLATIDNYDAVLVPNVVEAMCDEYSYAVLQDQVKPILDLCLGQRINTGGRFWPRLANVIGYNFR